MCPNVSGGHVKAREFAKFLRTVPLLVKSINHRDTMEELAVIVQESVENNFQRQTDVTGSFWPPRKDNLPHPLLIKTGKMKDAATGGRGHYKRAQRKGLQMGVKPDKVPYAKYHQHGTARLPQRQYFYLHSSDRARFRKLFHERTVARVRRAFGRLI